jgi:hypothetical protein
MCLEGHCLAPRALHVHGFACCSHPAVSQQCSQTETDVNLIPGKPIHAHTELVYHSWQPAVAGAASTQMPREEIRAWKGGGLSPWRFAAVELPILVCALFGPLYMGNPIVVRCMLSSCVLLFCEG